MKKTYIKPATHMAGMTPCVIMASSTSATIGEDDATGTYTEGIETTDGNGFTMESKYNAWDEWEE